MNNSVVAMRNSPYFRQKYTPQQTEEIMHIITRGGDAKDIHKKISEWRPGISIRAAEQQLERLVKKCRRNYTENDKARIRNIVLNGGTLKDVLKDLRRMRPKLSVEAARMFMKRYCSDILCTPTAKDIS